jgi:exopolysaccharide biosynthesis polyprenyl glycosylphosphotransferase
VALSPGAQHRLFIAGLLVGDALALALAFALAYVVRFETGLAVFQEVTPAVSVYVQRAVLMIPLWLVVCFFFHLYDEQYLLGGTHEYGQLFYACGLNTVILVGLAYFDEDFVIARGWLAIAWALSFTLLAAWRFTARRLVYRLRQHGYFLSPALIVGANEEGLALAEQFANWPASGLHVIGFVDEAARPAGDLPGGWRVLGGVGDLQRLVAEHGVRELVVATTALPRESLLEVFRAYGTSALVRIRMSSGLFEIMTTGVQVKEIGHVPLLSVNRVRLTGLDILLKTALDYALVVPGLIVISPLLLALALAVRLDSPGPVIFRRRVLGVGGRTFNAYKFRTMHVNGDDILARHPEASAALALNHKCPDDPRITGVGRWLRKTSMDELPQLFNVLLRQMSLVGPRMISPEEHEKYGKWDLNLLTIPPGITGLWQISGRSDVSYEERVRLDMSYIRNYTIWLDLHILLRTIPAVLKCRGAY